MINVDSDPFIPRPQARKDFLWGISEDTARRWQTAGKLPPLVRLSGRLVGWRKSTLEKFVAEREGVAS